MSKKTRRIYKQKNRFSIESDKNQLIRETQQMINQANNRLRALLKTYKAGSWSTKKLRNRLDSSTIDMWTSRGGGRIKKINANKTMTQIKGIQKAITQFLTSATSTKRGIKKQVQASKQGIRNLLSNSNKKISDKDAEFYFNMLNDSDFTYFADKIGASTLWSLIDDAIEYNYSEESWLDIINRYVTLNDYEISEKARRIYEKYVE